MTRGLGRDIHPARLGRDIHLARLGRDGIVAIEFAMLAPVMLVTMTMGYSALILHSGAVALETGTTAAARHAVIGVEAAPGGRNAAVRDIVTRHVCPLSVTGSGGCWWSGSSLSESDDGAVSPLGIRMRAYVDPRNLGRPEPFSDVAPENGVFDPGESYTDVNNNGQWDGDMGRAEAGGSGDYVVYEISMPQDVGNPLLFPLLGRVVVHHAELVVRNEPY